jgi:hypothetical protein
LHGDALDLCEQARTSQFGDAYAGPGARTPGKDFILHSSEEWQVPLQVHVVGRHLDDIFESTATCGQDKSKILPGCKELLLGVVDDVQVRRATHLACAIEPLPYLYRWDISGTLDQQTHAGRND